MLTAFFRSVICSLFTFFNIIPVLHLSLVFIAVTSRATLEFSIAFFYLLLHLFFYILLVYFHLFRLCWFDLFFFVFALFFFLQDLLFLTLLEGLSKSDVPVGVFNVLILLVGVTFFSRCFGFLDLGLVREVKYLKEARF